MPELWLDDGNGRKPGVAIFPIPEPPEEEGENAMLLPFGMAALSGAIVGVLLTLLIQASCGR